MIRIANVSDLSELSEMLYELYKELMPEHYSQDTFVYRQCIMEHILDSRDTVYIHDNGFFIVRDETEPMAPSLNRYNGIRVYIKPEHRRSSLLAKFYKRLFQDFPDGDILGMTEIGSDHIEVLAKRHELIAHLYKLKRS